MPTKPAEFLLQARDRMIDIADIALSGIDEGLIRADRFIEPRWQHAQQLAGNFVATVCDNFYDFIQEKHDD